MSRILISGYYGLSNAGDEAMLTAIVNSLRQNDKNIEITVLSGNPNETALRHRVEAVHRFNPLSVLHEMLKSDLIISGGGSLLQDVTSKRSLFYYLSIIGMGKVLNKKVMLFAQGIGPIRSAFAKKMTKNICSKADFITVRDQESFAELLDMGLPEEKILLTADAVLSLDIVEKEQGKKLLLDNGLDLKRPIIGISVRNWTNEDVCFKELAQALDEIKNKYQVQLILIPLQYPTDMKACLKVKQIGRAHV